MVVEGDDEELVLVLVTALEDGLDAAWVAVEEDVGVGFVVDGHVLYQLLGLVANI